MEAVQEPHSGPQANEDAEDFDKFWANAQRRQISLKNVMGVDVVLPPMLPLIFQAEYRRMKNASADDEKAVGRLVGLLFGQDAYQRWREAGMDLEQFSTLLLWGIANCSGNPISLGEAREQQEKAKQEKLAELKAAAEGGEPPKKAKGK